MKQEREQHEEPREQRSEDDLLEDGFTPEERLAPELKGSERRGDSPPPDVDMYREIPGDRVGG